LLLLLLLLLLSLPPQKQVPKKLTVSFPYNRRALDDHSPVCESPEEWWKLGKEVMDQGRGGEAGVSGAAGGVESSDSRSLRFASTGVSKFLTLLVEAIWY